MKTKTTKPIEIGTAVRWNWRGHLVRGSVVKIYLKSVTRTRDGKSVKRNGSPEKPAYLVRSAAGAEVLKLHTELKPV